MGAAQSHAISETIQQVTENMRKYFQRQYNVEEKLERLNTICLTVSTIKSVESILWDYIDDEGVFPRLNAIFFCAPEVKCLESVILGYIDDDEAFASTNSSQSPTNSTQSSANSDVDEEKNETNETDNDENSANSVEENETDESSSDDEEPIISSDEYAAEEKLNAGCMDNIKRLTNVVQTDANNHTDIGPSLELETIGQMVLLNIQQAVQENCKPSLSPKNLPWKDAQKKSRKGSQS